MDHAVSRAPQGLPDTGPTGPRSPYPVNDPGVTDPTGPGSEPDYLPAPTTRPATSPAASTRSSTRRATCAPRMAATEDGGPAGPYPVNDPGVTDPTGPGSEPDYLPGGPSNPGTRF
jgi:hypothetical protein